MNKIYYSYERIVGELITSGFLLGWVTVSGTNQHLGLFLQVLLWILYTLGLLIAISKTIVMPMVVKIVLFVMDAWMAAVIYNTGHPFLAFLVIAQSAFVLFKNFVYSD